MRISIVDDYNILNGIFTKKLELPYLGVLISIALIEKVSGSLLF